MHPPFVSLELYVRSFSHVLRVTVCKPYFPRNDTSNTINSLRSTIAATARFLFRFSPTKSCIITTLVLAVRVRVRVLKYGLPEIMQIELYRSR